MSKQEYQQEITKLTKNEIQMEEENPTEKKKTALNTCIAFSQCLYIRRLKPRG